MRLKSRRRSVSRDLPRAAAAGEACGPRPRPRGSPAARARDGPGGARVPGRDACRGRARADRASTPGVAQRRRVRRTGSRRCSASRRRPAGTASRYGRQGRRLPDPLSARSGDARRSDARAGPRRSRPPRRGLARRPRGRRAGSGASSHPECRAPAPGCHRRCPGTGYGNLRISRPARHVSRPARHAAVAEEPRLTELGEHEIRGGHRRQDDEKECRQLPEAEGVRER